MIKFKIAGQVKAAEKDYEVTLFLEQDSNGVVVRASCNGEINILNRYCIEGRMMIYRLTDPFKNIFQTDSGNQIKVV